MKAPTARRDMMYRKTHKAKKINRIKWVNAKNAVMGLLEDEVTVRGSFKTKTQSEALLRLDTPLQCVDLSKHAANMSRP